MKDYSQYLIKTYQHWNLSIHENQGYLGRCVIWCKRPEAMDLPSATNEEYQELIQIIREVKEVVTKVFRPDWFNYSFLGNEVRHLHCHLVPRYKERRSFNGMIFEDRLYGHNYQTDRSFHLPEAEVFNIRDAIKKELNATEAAP